METFLEDSFATIGAALDVLDTVLAAINSHHDFTPIIVTHPPARREGRVNSINDTLTLFDANWEKLEALEKRVSQIRTRATRRDSAVPVRLLLHQSLHCRMSFFTTFLDASPIMAMFPTLLNTRARICFECVHHGEILLLSIKLFGHRRTLQAAEIPII